jgi:hypothetical protein
MRTTSSCLAALVVGMCVTTLAHARPNAPDIFCENYVGAPACLPVAACSQCHVQTEPPTWGPYGEALRQLFPTDIDAVEFGQLLPDALDAVADLDSDGDGHSNIEEILGGSLPGDPGSVPGDIECPADVSELDYPICQYSPRHVFRKIHLDFCGQSPSYDSMEAFIALDEASQMVALDDALSSCVDGEFWLGKDGALWQLAHNKIRPVRSLKQGEDNVPASAAQIADYYDDYHLYVWSQIDDHDARSVLTADFFVQRNDAPTSYVVVQDLDSQHVEQTRRVGNITSAWFLNYFVMFTLLPRSAAAQAYRGYLGLDFAKSEVTFSVDGEPIDYDQKGVAAPACAGCHEPLDPSTYPFSRYNGLTGAPGMGRASYNSQRLELLSTDPLLISTPEAGFVLGQAVQDLVEWGQVAANSDEFAIAAVRDYWRLLMGRDVDLTTSEKDEFDALWQGFKTDHTYSVEKMLHDFIRTEAYGAP